MPPARFLFVMRLAMAPVAMTGAQSHAWLDRPVSGVSIAAQEPDRIDVGSFTLYVDEQRAGREQFSIQRVTSADGTVLELRAESAMGERRTARRLETDTGGSPLRYSIEERVGAAVTLRLGGQRVRGRFATLSRSTSGEAAREFILAPGAMVLEDDGVFQYALFARHQPLAAGDSVMIPVLTPIANRQGNARLTLFATNDTVVIAGSRRAARQWRVVANGGDLRMIWADADGRLLRVRIPSRRFDAVRDDVPR